MNEFLSRISARFFGLDRHDRTNTTIENDGIAQLKLEHNSRGLRYDPKATVQLGPINKAPTHKAKFRGTGRFSLHFVEGEKYIGRADYDNGLTDIDVEPGNELTIR